MKLGMGDRVRALTSEKPGRNQIRRGPNVRTDPIQRNSPALDLEGGRWMELDSDRATSQSGEKLRKIPVVSVTQTLIGDRKNGIVQ